MKNLEQAQKANSDVVAVTLAAVLALALTAIVLTGCHKSATMPKPPATEVRVVRDIYHGVEVDDPYRWLENWNDANVKAWSEAQNAYARSFLDRLPGVAAISARVKEIVDAASVSYHSLVWRPGRLFAVKQQPPLNQPLLVTMPSADEPASEKVVLDLNTLDPSGHTSVDWYAPSPDGRLVGVSLSAGGSESGDVHIYDAETGGDMADVIPRVNGGTAGGDMAWLPDGKGFYYTRYPRAGERPAEDMDFFQQVWYHELGTPVDKDSYILGRDFPRIAEIKLRLDDRSGRLLVTVQDGDSGRFAHFIVEPGGDVRQVTKFEDGVVEAVWGRADDLYLISRYQAPRGRILHLAPADAPLEKAKVIVPEGNEVIISTFSSDSLLVATEDRLYVTYQLGGPSEIRAFSLDGQPLDRPAAVPLSSVHEVAPLDAGRILFLSSSYVEPPAWYNYDPARNATKRTALFSTSPVDFSDAEVAREFAVSKDGTKVPVDLIIPKGIALDGAHPAILYGYGGYGVSLSPAFSAMRHVWIEQGVVYAVAVTRGGGEFGEDWHRSGALTRKQNVFDDFAAAMKHLVSRGYTRPERLAIIGGSNGGLLMGAMIVQHPDLFRATVSSVGIYDMLRNELTPNGTFNVPEYGTVKDKAQFEALHAYSPYHHVKDGVAYPAILFMTGANDPRVDPMHSRKMTARLQAATSSGNLILLRTSSTTGHGIGTPLAERVKEDVDEFAFLFYELGVTYKPTRTGFR
jgi:prolyl oligopeptidase